MVEQPEEARAVFARRQLKANSLGVLRPDVMMYIASALQTFERLGPQKRNAVALEIAMLGRNGMDINDPDDKYTMTSLLGKLSGLRLLAIMYTALRHIDPTIDTGAYFSADLSAEFKAATEMQSKEGGWAARPSGVALCPVVGAHAYPLAAVL